MNHIAQQPYGMADRIRALEAALAPFAEFAATIADRDDETAMLAGQLPGSDMKHGWRIVTVADFRRTAKAMEAGNV